MNLRKLKPSAHDVRSETLTNEQQQAILDGDLVVHSRDCLGCGIPINVVAPPDRDVEDGSLPWPYCTRCAAELADPAARP